MTKEEALALKPGDTIRTRTFTWVVNANDDKWLTLEACPSDGQDYHLLHAEHDFSHFTKVMEASDD